MKLRTLSSALALAGLAFAGTGHAAGISDDVIRIGFITDMSSVYSDIDGPAGVDAVKMAIEDAGGSIDGKKIELITADHQNKADVASARAREWIDERHIDLLLGGTNSGVNLAMAGVAKEKHVPFIAVGPGSSNLTNSQCSPYTIHYAYDTVALARGTGGAVVKNGGKSWFFLTADYAFGHSLERDTTKVVKDAGGEVVGSVNVPLATTDFSSYMLQAQSSGAKILGLANAGGDFVNSVKAAKEFGVSNTMNLAGLLVFINDVHALGLEATQGMYLTSAWYWDQDDASRKWAERFFERNKRMPSFLQAGDYSAVSYFLRAVKEAGTDDADTVMKWMKSNKIDDFFTHDTTVRADGRVLNQMYLMQVKTPAESKKEWDYYKVVAKMKGEDVYTSPEESTCPLLKK
ncbi:ABC transporter substrate-binding protein [Allopusillimonas soli]|uniref:ABC transporter substrate-binding protein n=1 Tax=Allopusillimonas soli TaxID=659016 RepID=A0A853FK36_9BURK|nr:ABC transporter substrate-binding protein [Allopusillimonas soli]NYT38296.1 ABC transporter substrate-binding protein [Allopusillimonas soli]TEA72132.1 ABC transporter substrate-binding protein [Allopusillimonas soli]